MATNNEAKNTKPQADTEDGWGDAPGARANVARWVDSLDLVEGNAIQGRILDAQWVADDQATGPWPFSACYVVELTKELAAQPKREKNPEAVAAGERVMLREKAQMRDSFRQLFVGDEVALTVISREKLKGGRTIVNFGQRVNLAARKKWTEKPPTCGERLMAAKKARSLGEVSEDDSGEAPF